MHVAALCNARLSPRQDQPYKDTQSPPPHLIRTYMEKFFIYFTLSVAVQGAWHYMVFNDKTIMSWSPWATLLVYLGGFLILVGGTVLITKKLLTY